MKKLGLFPLKVVLFPDSYLPLHIFEERYKLLINKCMNENSLFGINFNDSVKMYEIGCSAIVDNVMKRYDDGKMDIVVKGINRYRLNHFKEGENLYYEGEIEDFGDVNEKIDYSVLRSCIEKYNAIADKLRYLNLERYSIEKLSGFNPSFVLAQKAGMTLNQRQELLELQSENQRLSLLHEHLDKVLPMAKEAEVLNKIIRNDGYFQY